MLLKEEQEENAAVNAGALNQPKLAWKAFKRFDLETTARPAALTVRKCGLFYLTPLTAHQRVPVICLA